MPKYIDIHTHKNYNSTSNTLSLNNLLLHKINEIEIDSSKFYSAGWHPWFIKNYDFEFIKKAVVDYSNKAFIKAIGECGIDRAIDTPIALQVEVFKIHILCAKNTKKPLIVHAVRSYSDILNILKNEAFKGVAILHDFRGNLQQLQQLLKYNTFFSFGKALLSDPQRAPIFNYLSLDRIFFETDENNISIEKIYLRAAKIKEMPVDDLKMQVINNYNRIFGNVLD